MYGLTGHIRQHNAPQKRRTNTEPHSVFNIHYFSTVRMVTRTRLNVSLYVHCLSFLGLNLVVHEVITGH